MIYNLILNIRECLEIQATMFYFVVDVLGEQEVSSINCRSLQKGTCSILTFIQNYTICTQKAVQPVYTLERQDHHVESILPENCTPVT